MIDKEAEAAEAEGEAVATAKKPKAPPPRPQLYRQGPSFDLCGITEDGIKKDFL